MDPALKARFPYTYWSISDTKTYGVYAACILECLSLHDLLAGTAVLSKIKPLTINKIIPGHPDPKQVKGRIITLEFENCFVVATYVVNAGQNLKVYDYLHCLTVETRPSA